MEPPCRWDLSWKEDGATSAKVGECLRTGGRPHRSLRSLDVPHPAADLLSSPLPRALTQHHGWIVRVNKVFVDWLYSGERGRGEDTRPQG